MDGPNDRNWLEQISVWTDLRQINWSISATFQSSKLQSQTHHTIKLDEALGNQHNVNNFDRKQPDWNLYNLLLSKVKRVDAQLLPQEDVDGTKPTSKTSHHDMDNLYISISLFMQ